MSSLTLKVGFAFFPYGGNGSTSSEVPDIRNWICATLAKIRRDDRISDVVHRDFSDTPITMTRNAAVIWARNEKVDVLVMIDSDMQPDCEALQDPQARPFWDTSFDFIYKKWNEGPHVVCAPYTGPPPDSNVYVFRWAIGENDCPNAPPRIDQYTREEAATLGGIMPCAAQPTGLIMWDMRAFELTDPKLTGAKNGWFYYEWTDCYAAEKGSTEDVTATRDIAMAGHLKYGRDVIFCNWDAWAGHWKPKLMRKPRIMGIDGINERFVAAVKQGWKIGEQTRPYESPMLDEILANQRRLDATKKQAPKSVTESGLPSERGGRWQHLRSNLIGLGYTYCEEDRTYRKDGYDSIPFFAVRDDITRPLQTYEMCEALYA